MKLPGLILAVLAAMTMHAVPADCEAPPVAGGAAPASVGVPAVQGRAAREYLATGDRFFGKGEFNTAVASYDKAMELDPSLLNAMNNKGVALHCAGRYEEAVGCYDRLISAKPDGSLAYINKGNALSELGRFGEAAACFESAAKLDPNSATAYNFLGLALDYQGEHADAVKAFDRSIKLDARMPEPLNNKAYSLICLKKYDKALACLDEALALAPGYRYALINKAYVLQLRGAEGDSSTAVVVLAELLNRDARDVIAARAYALLGMKDEMLSVINALLADNPRLAKDFRGNAKFEKYRDDPDFKAIVGE